MPREKLPKERPSITRRFKITYVDDGNQPHVFRFYAVAGMHDDGRIAEVFFYTNRKHSDVTSKLIGLLAGALDAVGTAISIGLQHGAPLDSFTAKLRNNHFGPSGFTGDQEFPSCTSMFDLAAQWLIKTFPNGKYAGGFSNR
jgi:ribonucleoside-diphosphate reductase alpha chain